MKAEVTMYQPCRSSGHPAGPLRPAAPAPVLTAVRLMYAGAAVSAVCLVISLTAAVGDISAAVRGRWLGYSLTAARLGQLQPLIVAVVMAGGLVVIALWLWMARANGQGRSWARTLSTVLSGLAALQLAGGLSRPAVHVVSGVEVLALLGAVLAWLPGLAAVWLLWRPVSSAFFTPQGLAQAGA
jgi:hypothetical protein